MYCLGLDDDKRLPYYQTVFICNGVVADNPLRRNPVLPGDGAQRIARLYHMNDHGCLPPFFVFFILCRLWRTGENCGKMILFDDSQGKSPYWRSFLTSEASAPRNGLFAPRRFSGKTPKALDCKPA